MAFKVVRTTVIEITVKLPSAEIHHCQFPKIRVTFWYPYIAPCIVDAVIYFIPMWICCKSNKRAPSTRWVVELPTLHSTLTNSRQQTSLLLQVASFRPLLVLLLLLLLVSCARFRAPRRLLCAALRACMGTPMAILHRRICSRHVLMS